MLSRGRFDWLTLREKRVLVAGAGGIGTSIALLLARSGVGHITVIDRDVVEESNLNRQFLYTPDDVGEYKAKLLAERLKEGFPVDTSSLVGDIGELDVDYGSYDVVVDALDHWRERRKLMERVLPHRGYFLISAAEGKGMVVHTSHILPFRVRDSCVVSLPEIWMGVSIGGEAIIRYLVSGESGMENSLVVYDVRSLYLQKVSLEDVYALEGKGEGVNEGK